jgi:hypothetical protein
MKEYVTSVEKILYLDMDDLFAFVNGLSSLVEDLK